MARAHQPSVQTTRSYRSTTSLARGIRKARPVRRSARLQQKQAHRSLFPHQSNVPDAQLQSVTTIQPSTQKRKRSCAIDTSEHPRRKKQRSSSTPAEGAYKDTTSDDIAECSCPIDYWRKHQCWPQSFFESGTMSQRPTKGSSSGTLRRKASTSSSASGETSEEKKSSPYHKATFTALLQTTGSYIFKYVSSDGRERGPLKTSSDLCQKLLETPQPVPQDSRFSDELFEKTCERLCDRNESKVVQDIARLIVPSVEDLSDRGWTQLDILVESVNEIWKKSIPLHRDFPRPKPDYSVGFHWNSFGQDRFEKLKMLVGDVMDTSASLYATTYLMYFPFFTCEVKCGAAALDTADRQNLHSATIAVRAVVELFRLVKREQELNREILAFSVSHNSSSVRIYGHYPVIDGKETKYYRHSIRDFSFKEQDGKEKWTTYKFTRNVCDSWMPGHFQRICSVIDDIPSDVSFDVSEESKLSSFTGPSEAERPNPTHSEGSTSVANSSDRLSITEGEHTTPDTSVSQGGRRLKRKR